MIKSSLIALLVILCAVVVADEVWTGDTRDIVAVHLASYQGIPIGEDYPYEETNWPVRCHIELSFDGGLTYPQRVGWGVPSATSFVAMAWSIPPPEKSWFSTNAVFRVIDLDNKVFCSSIAPFTMAGCVVESPTNGHSFVNGDFVTISWVQAGAEGVMDLGYLTPSNTLSWIDTVAVQDAPATNVWEDRVTVTNGFDVIRFVVRSQTDHRVFGVSGDVTVE